jgi:hypothetical protein
MSLAAKRVKLCKACGSEFQPYLSTQVVCRNPLCAIEFVRQKAKKEFKQETRKRKVALLDDDASHWTKNARRQFNRFIRLRDQLEPCISCGRREVEWTRGGNWDCGHFRSVGAMPQLRFEELNAHKQCKSCNGGSSKYARKGETVSKEYERNLAKKIGDLKMVWLKGPHPAKHYRVDDLKEIYRTYRLKADALEKSGDCVGRGGTG